VNSANAAISQAPNGPLRLPGASGNYVSAPDAVENSITGDIDLRAKVAMDSWAPAFPLGRVMGKWSTGQRNWYLEISSGGSLQLGWSTDGTNAFSVASSATLGLAAGAVKWIRATQDVDDGAGNNIVKFYTSNDGITWTQLGTDRVTVGAFAFMDSTAPLQVGATDGSGSNAMAGYMYYAEVRDGINGPVVAAFDAVNVTKTNSRSPATVTQGNANLLSANVTGIETDATGWQTGSNTPTLARDTTQFLDGVASLSLTATAVGPASMSAYTATRPAVTVGITYTFMAHFKAAATARSVRLDLAWYDSLNNWLSAVTGTTITDSTTGWTTVVVSGVAPTLAVTCLPTLVVLNAVSGEVHYADRMMLWASTTNLLTVNQTGLETDTTGWQAYTNATISRSTAQASDGAASLAITATATGVSAASSQAITTAVNAGVTYTASLQIRAATTPRTCFMLIDWWAVGGLYLSSSALSSNVTDSTSVWSALTVSAVAPAGAISASVRVHVNDAAQAAGEVHYIDRIMLTQVANLQTPWTLNGSYWSWPIALDGANTLAMTALASGDMKANLASGTSAIPVVGGKTYTLEGWVRAGSTTRSVVMAARRYDSGGVQVGVIQQGSSVSAVTTGWIKATYTFVTESNAVFVQPVLTVMVAGAAGETFYFDRISLVAGTGGDLDIRVKLVMDDWTPSAEMGLVAKFQSASNYSYSLSVRTDGTLRLYTSSDGSTAVSHISSVATGVADGTVKWVRATLDVDFDGVNGQVKFWLSNDGVTWTQLGTTITRTGIAILFNSTVPLKVGALDGTASPLAGNIYYAEVRNGIDTAGDIIANPSFENQPWDIGETSGATGTDVAGNTWTLQGTAIIQRAFASDLDIRVKATSDNWAIINNLVNKGFGATGASYRFYAFNNALTLALSSENTVFSYTTSTTTFTANGIIWLRVTWQASNGQVQFFTSVDGTTWVQLGTNLTNSKVGIYDGPSAVYIGTLAGTSEMMTGNVFYAEIRNSIGGVVIANPNFEARPWDFGETGGTIGADAIGNTWTLSGTAIIQRAFVSDLDIRVKAALDNWTPSGYALVAKWADGGGVRSYQFSHNVGYLMLQTTATGTSSYISSTATAATPFANSKIGWVRVTLDADNGSNQHVVTFYYSGNGDDWIQIGAAITNSGLAMIFDGTGGLQIGASGVATNPVSGNVYYVELRNNIRNDGTGIVTNPDFSRLPWVPGDVAPKARTDKVGNTWTLQGAASIQGTIPNQDCELVGASVISPVSNIEEFCTVWCS
jgi:hypothetical protein